MTENYQDDTLRIFSLNANRPLAEKIAASVGTELGRKYSWRSCLHHPSNECSCK